MKKVLGFLVMSILIIIFTGCGGGGSSSSSSGSAGTGAGGAGAKGPFVAGSVVKAYQLDNNGNRMSNFVQTTTTGNLGHYSLTNITWSGATEIEITGNYFNENDGSNSTTPATLSAIVNVVAGQTLNANINVFTDLAAQRIKALMQSGTALDTARTQAQNAIVQLFDLNISTGVHLEDLDLTDGSGPNAKVNAELLRISAAIALDPDILDILREGIQDGNITNDPIGKGAFVRLGNIVDENISLNTISANLEGDLNITDAPDANDTDVNASWVDSSLGHAPVIAPIPDVTIDEDSGVHNITIYATDEDNDTLHYSASGWSFLNGPSTGVTNNVISINPRPNQYGVVTMTARVDDGTGLAATRTFTVTVNPVNDAPVAVDDTAQTDEDTNVTINVLANDNDVDGDTLHVSLSTSSVTGGTVTMNGNSVIFTPNPNFNGTGSFMYEAVDSNGLASNDATVTITVIPVNDAPVAVDDTAQTNEDTNVTINVLANDTDADTGDTKSIQSVTQPTNGTVTNQTTDILYTPNANFYGTDSFSYTMQDANGSTSTATVTVTVNQLYDDPPILANSEINVSEATPSNTVIGSVTVVNTGDGNITSYRLISGGDGNFTVENNGSIKLIGNLDYETTTTYILNIDANNSAGRSNDINVTINVTDVFEAANIQGGVVDAPVKSANVSVYSDPDFTNLIGSGTTDSNGNFDFNLTVQTIPDPVYIRTTGGYNIDDGMPAVSMDFIGSVNSDGRYYITPLTDYVRDRMLGGEDFATAKSAAVTYFGQSVSGFSEDDLFGNPLTNADSNTTVNAIIQNGTAGISLKDGNYKCLIFDFTESDVGSVIQNLNDIPANNLDDFNISISNGIISGTTSEGVVSGVISGKAVLMTILIPDANNPTEISKFAGTIGMLGSVSGTYTTLDTSTTPVTLSKGVFAGEFIPATGVNISNFASKVINFATGNKNFLFKEYIGDGTAVGFGNLSINGIEPVDYNITMSDMNITSEENTTSSISGLIFTAGDSKLFEDYTMPTSIAMMSFAIPSSMDGGTIYLIQPIGLRQSIFVETNSSGNITGIGDAVLNKQGTFAPNLEADTDYEINVFSSGIWLLNQDRSQLLQASMSVPLSTTGMDAQVLASTFDANVTFDGDTTKWIFAGGNVLMYKDDNGNDLGDMDIDFIRSFKILGSNAFYGEDISGGMFNGLPIRNFPSPFVGKIRPTATSSFSAYSGNLHFAARVLYTTQQSDYADYTYGTVDIAGNSASFVTNDGNYNLTADYNATSGIYHIYGQPEGDFYLDIIWPVGSPKAIFTTTYDGNQTIESVGEAYLTE